MTKPKKTTKMCLARLFWSRVGPRRGPIEVSFEWKAKQAKIDQMKRKNAKPAFKAGVVHYSV